MLANGTAQFFRQGSGQTIKCVIDGNRHNMTAAFHCMQNLLPHPVILIHATVQCTLRQDKQEHGRLADGINDALVKHSILQFVVV